MSPNPNYKAGRAFEYKRKKHYESEGYTVIRAAGSHGPFDLVAFGAKTLVCAIQCKRCNTIAESNRLIESFRKDPPLPKSSHFIQVMEVWIKKERKLVSTTI